MAEIYVTETFSPFYKVKGTNSVYNPRVNKKNLNQESISHIWVQNGGTNKIAFGWHVSFNSYIIFRLNMFFCYQIIIKNCVSFLN